MTTDRTRSEYYENNSNDRGIVTNRSTNGQYTIIEKDFGDHKLYYYIPSSYEDDYDISQLDEIIYDAEEEEQNDSYPTTIIRRKYYQHYDDDDDYTGELPLISPRRYAYTSPRRPLLIRRIYYEPPLSPPPTVKYIYEDDYRSKNEDPIEYIVRKRVPKLIYIEEPQPTRRITYIENLPPISSSPRRPSPLKLPYLNDLSSSRRSKLKQHTPRNESSNKRLIRNNDQRNYLSLKEVIAENRVRRGSRIRKPRREVDEDEIYDPPTYRKNFIKNGFIVHK